MPAERLQKVLAAAGVASRRSAESMIAAGRVTVDGRVAGIGAQADPERSIITVDGRIIGSAVAHAYLVLHKPAGVTSTTRDRHADTTVLDLVPTALIPDGARLYPVGRLDQDSEGMLLLTNDGAWADRVLHPRHGVEREYALGLDRPLDGEQVAALQGGIRVEEGLATLGGLRTMTAIETDRLAKLLRPSPPKLTWYRATLTQGWKRQLRRMFGAVGTPVNRLVRVRIGPVRIDGLRSGAVRPLKAPEVRGLGAGAGRSRAAQANPGREVPDDREVRGDRYPSRDGRVGGGPRRAGVVRQEQRRRSRGA
jgi:23S rRNA pseudouridine2605 synthase